MRIVMKSISVGLIAVTLVGCAASGSPGYDSRFGDAVRAINAQQIIDPAAAKRNAGQNGASDGRTVREAMERHTDSYKAPAKSSVTSVGVAAGASN